MALSKCSHGEQSSKKLLDSDFCEDAQLVEGLLAIVSPEILRRPLRPLFEIGLDFCELGEAVVKALSGPRTVGCGRLASTHAIENAAEKVRAEALPSFPLSPLRSMRLALEELAADFGFESLCGTLVPASIVLLLCGVAPSALSVGAAASGQALILLKTGGAHLSLHILHGVSAFGLGVSSVMYFSRHDTTHVWRCPMRLAGLALAVVAAGQAYLYAAPFLGQDYWLTEWLSKNFAEPDLAFHFIVDSVAIPLQLINIGLISGRTVRLMAPLCTLAAAGSLCMAGAEGAFDPSVRMSCFMASSVFFATSMFGLGFVPKDAERLGDDNLRRSIVSTDLFRSIWSAYPVIHFLASHDMVGITFQRQLLILLQSFMQVGTAHLTLRSISVVMNTGAYFSAPMNYRRPQSGGQPARRPPPPMTLQRYTSLPEPDAEEIPDTP
eukprot:TRINITY_DN63420_c0_g1_i1.p1 TRINITY_DN63420_c0_g1~~TRINITY_DN63420_c0_g1_i1.p1  ORF type:complete len:438 (+),score=51.78 TRINITY_DN63420_c0_g1_i1:52-1365(+)